MAQSPPRVWGGLRRLQSQLCPQEHTAPHKHTKWGEGGGTWVWFSVTLYRWTKKRCREFSRYKIKMGRKKTIPSDDDVGLKVKISVQLLERILNSWWVEADGMKLSEALIKKKIISVLIEKAVFSYLPPWGGFVVLLFKCIQISDGIKQEADCFTCWLLLKPTKKWNSFDIWCKLLWGKMSTLIQIPLITASH